MDVDTAYLKAKLKDLLYLKIPISYKIKDEKTNYLIVRKALYGAKQSGRAWYEHLTTFLRTLGYTQLKTDTCVFYQKSANDELLFICIYVDDFLIVGFY
jgi:hypothetical protein